MTNATLSMTTAQKIESLRARFKEEWVCGFIIPRADEYQGEYVPDSSNRLLYISGFTGSAGTCVVLDDAACVLSDGRYTIQLKQQVDQSVFTVEDSTKVPVAEWVALHAKGRALGYDPRLHTPRDVKAMEDAGVSLKPLRRNLVDAIWMDRPPAPAESVELFPVIFAGLSAPEKIDHVVAALKTQGTKAAIITLPDSIAWMLNIRSSDIPHIPIALSNAIVHDNGMVDWFIDASRVSPSIAQSFGNRVSIHAPDAIEGVLDSLSGQKVLADGRRTSKWFFDVMNRNDIRIIDAKDPVIELKAIKNDSEQNAMRNAHIRDGIAMVRFLKWFEVHWDKAPLTEMDVEKKLEEFRRAAREYRDSSFDTIAGFGSNGAIVHYRATQKTNKMIEGGNLLLLDSGAQYADGTTDITRTIAVGTPTDEMREHYTLVLKGHLAVSMARFPLGTTGAQIDALARAPLWQRNLDYAHGTGHGVGCYLSVHEEATSFSPRGTDAVAAGMVISNEPGYYREGMYGIRIENLVIAQEDGVCADTGKTMMVFETLTLAPYDKNLIVREMLTTDEQAWINAYHARVVHTLSPFLGDEEINWLTKLLLT
jgi:Xaa-Pro aminopeptidase